MQYKLFFFSLISLFILTAPGCKKTNTEEQLPPETHEGNFTFGCKVDGKIFIASGKDGPLSNKYVSFDLINSDSSIFISARNTTQPNFSLTLKINYSGSLGMYVIRTFPYYGTFSDYTNGSIPGSSNTYTTSNNYNGKVVIKYFNGSYNPYNNGTILSGTFEMDAVNANGKVVHITEGRFDIGQ